MGPPFVGTSQLSAIKADCYCDIICQVVGCFSFDGTDTILRIWDGSKLSDGIDRSDMAVVDSLDLDVQADLRGYYVDVFVHDEHKLAAQETRPKDFVVLKNVHAYRPGSDTFDKKILVLHGGNCKGRGIFRCPTDCGSSVGLFKRMVATMPGKLEELRAARLRREADEAARLAAEEDELLVVFDSRHADAVAPTALRLSSPKSENTASAVRRGRPATTSQASQTCPVSPSSDGFSDDEVTSRCQALEVEVPENGIVIINMNPDITVVVSDEPTLNSHS